ncbi:MAG TPA: hypothetical protein VGA61_11245 [Anaerolineae bacterium]
MGDLVDLEDVHCDLAVYAEEFMFPADGPGFVAAYLLNPPLERFSPRNVRGYARSATRARSQWSGKA